MHATCLTHYSRNQWLPCVTSIHLFSMSLFPLILVTLPLCHCCNPVSHLRLSLVTLLHWGLLPCLSVSLHSCLLLWLRVVCLRAITCHVVMSVVSVSLRASTRNMAALQCVTMLLIWCCCFLCFLAACRSISCYPVARIIALCHAGSCLLDQIQLHGPHRLWVIAL